MNEIQMIWPFLSFLMTILFTLIAWLIKKQIAEYEGKLQSFEERLGRVEQSQRQDYSEMQKNFNTIRDHIDSTEKNIIRELYKMQVYNANTFVKKIECDCKAGEG